MIGPAQSRADWRAAEAPRAGAAPRRGRGRWVDCTGLRSLPLSLLSLPRHYVSGSDRHHGGKLIVVTALEPTGGQSQSPESKPTCEGGKNAVAQTDAHDLDKACHALAQIVARWPLLTHRNLALSWPLAFRKSGRTHAEKREGHWD